eukprot:CAMPEP_0174284850 /NCGR_PEP_ID=MMETSP0809-20121228/6860_1 /TAXON_ID=73025 ORGANISM="Eutreptiella gymnastica-like, Strain CCMP1594" /NCGR_SAMPLE_ID=MMETSP0809 /ASSEMBLY_ACC=CAM_ASM_000658 /LENGTH=49 /DNA_ID= /DNA_START= /DNA_END= /DNA_ORIENTATION=
MPPALSASSRAAGLRRKGLMELMIDTSLHQLELLHSRTEKCLAMARNAS